MKNIRDDILAGAAPLYIWDEAVKQAERSSHKRFRTGAVIFYGMGISLSKEADHALKLKQVYSTGTSHFHNGGLSVRSVHAEMHAIERLPKSSGGAKCLIVTLTKAGNFAQNSRPCTDCSRALERRVWSIIYPVCANDGSWSVQVIDPKLLIADGSRRTRHGPS